VAAVRASHYRRHLLEGRYGALRRSAASAAGFLVWTYTLLLPSFAKSGWLPITFLSHGLFGTDLLKPQQLLGLQGLDDITHCLFWSMLVNIGCYVGVSLIRDQCGRARGKPPYSSTPSSTR